VQRVIADLKQAYAIWTWVHWKPFELFAAMFRPQVRRRRTNLVSY